MRREWIEIRAADVRQIACNASPSMRREWIEICERCQQLSQIRSPSMRREWIEMNENPKMEQFSFVSLHAEGVD